MNSDAVTNSINFQLSDKAYAGYCGSSQGIANNSKQYVNLKFLYDKAFEDKKMDMEITMELGKLAVRAWHADHHH